MTAFPGRPAGDPDARQDATPDIAGLQATDALLSRLGRRGPTADDLDDPIVAALAVFAADIDLDATPPARTRNALQTQGQWPLQTLEEVAPGVVVDRGVRVSLPVAPPRAAPWTLEPVDPPVPPTRGELRLRPLPVAAAAAAALVLSMSAAAAVTKGESVNPVKAVSVVVQQLTREPPASVPATPRAGTATHVEQAGVSGSGSGNAGTKSSAGASPSGSVATRVGSAAVDAVPPAGAPTPTTSDGDQSSAVSVAATTPTDVPTSTPDTPSPTDPPSSPPSSPAPGHSRPPGDGGHPHGNPPPPRP